MSPSEFATRLASLTMLVSAGCARPPATLSPTAGFEPARTETDASCPDTPTTPQASEGDGLAPQIVDARFVAGDRVMLTFSEALAPTKGVNPRQFRLSWAYSLVDLEEGYAAVYYQELGGTDLDEVPVVVQALVEYADRPEVLGLRLNQGVPVDVCTELAELKADFDEAMAEADATERGEVGLFLHYTERGSVVVRDRSGVPLGDIGGAWALHHGARHHQAYGAEPVARLDLLVRLDCPVNDGLMRDTPPGPM